MRRNKEQKDDAVSPVVGVMLMLVVTIVIAAVVSAFAGGMGTSQKAAPQASIAVKTGYLSDGNFDISFEHLGGDPILTRDCQFITYLTLQNGTTIKHVQTPSSPLARSESYGQINGNPSYSRGPHLTDPQKYAYPCNPINDVTVMGGWVVPGITNLTAFPEGANYAWFGQAVWLPGDIARTYNNGYTANFLGLIPTTYTGTPPTMENPYPGTNETYQAGIATLKDCVAKNCRLDIKLMHMPSGKYIMDKSIVLQG